MKIITALDVNNAKDALKLVRMLKNISPYFKVGMELFYSEGKKILDTVYKEGGKIFLDLKFYDIPNTVAKAVRTVMHPSIFMLNAHCLSGSNVLKAFVKSAKEKSKELNMPIPKLIGVTLITSLNQKHLNEEFKIKNTLKDEVKYLARLAKKSGLTGVVCSPHEIKLVEKICGANFITVVPGIRPKGVEKQDQSRIMTPDEAAKAGADYLVIGRPITQADNPEETLKKIIYRYK